MAYDEELAGRIRVELGGEPDMTERKMFGGLGFMVSGNMAVAAGSGGSLMVRADPATSSKWVDGEGVRPMEMRGGPIKGWLLVSTEALAEDAALALWVGRGASYAKSLPPK